MNNKNCEIYMYDKNVGFGGAEKTLMKNLKNIFKHKNTEMYSNIYKG